MFRKRFANNWQMLLSYTWQDAEGNTNSDGNADFQGDVDLPRSARAEPVRHAAGPDPEPAEGRRFLHVPVRPPAWRHVHLELGNGGQPHLPRVGTQPAAARPGREAFEFAGYTTRWLAPDSVATLENPSWGQIDLRAQYNRRLMREASIEFFVDLFNVMNSQGSIRNQDLVAGSGGKAFGDPILWVNPRRAFLGTRVKF